MNFTGSLAIVKYGVVSWTIAIVLFEKEKVPSSSMTVFNKQVNDRLIFC